MAKCWFGLFLLVTGVAIGLPVTPSYAEPKSYVCPQSIGMIARNSMAEAVMERMNVAYQELGCITDFVALPSKRAILQFNQGASDGELFRLSLVEDLYTTDFVRSDPPLFEVRNSLWVHPDEMVRHSKPLGYLDGVLWQENYVIDRRAAPFRSTEQLHRAFKQGIIGSFLGSDPTLILAINKGTFAQPPMRMVTLIERPIYHYLSAKYEPFMNELSQYLMKRDLFRGLLMVEDLG